MRSFLCSRTRSAVPLLRTRVSVSSTVFPQPQFRFVTGATGGDNATGGNQSQAQKEGTPMKPARTYTLELNRAKAEFLRCPTQQQRALALRAIEETPLSKVNQCDAKVVASVLTTLGVLAQGTPASSDTAAADAGTSSGTAVDTTSVCSMETKVVDDCARWLVSNVTNCSENLLITIAHQCLALGYGRSAELVGVILPKVREGLPNMSTTALAMLYNILTIYPQQCPDLLATLPDTLSSHIDGMSLTDVTLVLRAVARSYQEEQGSTTDSLSHSRFMEALTNRVQTLTVGDGPGQMNEGAAVALLEALGGLPPNPALHSVGANVLTKFAGFATGSGIEGTPAVLNREQKLRLLTAWLNSAVCSTELATRITSQLLEEAAKDQLSTMGNRQLGKLAHALCANTTTEGIKTHQEALLEELKSRLLTAGDGEVWSAEGTDAVLTHLYAVEPTAVDEWVGQTLNKAMKSAAEGSGKDSIAAPLLVEQLAKVLQHGEIVSNNEEKILELVKQHAAEWTLPDLQVILSNAALHSVSVRNVARALASTAATLVKDALPSALVAIISSYGRLRVREEPLCHAASTRLLQVRKDLSQTQLTKAIQGFSLMDYRNSKVFVDLLPSVRGMIHTFSGPEVCALAAAYARMLVWNYKLYARLADQALDRISEIGVEDMCLILSAFRRVELRHDRLFKGFLSKAMANADKIPASDALSLLVVFSELHIWDPQLYDTLAATIAADPSTMDADTIGHFLLSFARVELEHRHWFEKLSMRCLELAPTCSPSALANIITAYATVGYRHVELFTVLADRALATKQDCPALTVAAVLVAFAKVDIRNDKLFIEMIPRVRYVAHHGTAQDVANVLTAYTSVRLWHYKLFVRLAERAIALRGDCRGLHIVPILAAFAQVEMRYEKLFTEFSPRIQSIMHTLTAAEMTSIVHSYSAVKILDTPIFTQIAERAVALKDEFDDGTIQQLIQSFIKINFHHQGFSETFGAGASAAEEEPTGGSAASESS